MCYAPMMWCSTFFTFFTLFAPYFPYSSEKQSRISSISSSVNPVCHTSASSYHPNIIPPISSHPSTSFTSTDRSTPLIPPSSLKMAMVLQNGEAYAIVNRAKHCSLHCKRHRRMFQQVSLHTRKLQSASSACDIGGVCYEIYETICS
jgi:hypothetical protein